LPCPLEKLEPRQKNLDQYRRNAYWYRQQGTNTTASLFRAAMEWMDAPRDKCFLWIDAFDPHEPWDAPAEFRKPYPWNDQGAAVIWPRQGYASKYTEADLENMRSLYRAEVTQIDHWVGQFLSLLRGRGALENTAVIFCSDHGYYFGEHSFVGKLFDRHFEKPTTIYEELGHLPLLVRHPQGLAAGKTIPGLAQPPDLFSTVLDLAGIAPVSWAQGHSLVPRLQGAVSPQHVACGGCHPHKRGGVSCLSVCTDEWYLVYSPHHGLDGSELYHLPDDPAQTRNVIADHRQVAQQLFGYLSRWLDDLGVTPARQQQFLHGAPFKGWNRLKDQIGLWKKRASYIRRYKDYARGA
jgi:arylsulfatase A-like enzyme